jgi:hypothetical protein
LSFELCNLCFKPGLFLCQSSVFLLHVSDSFARRLSLCGGKVQTLLKGFELIVVLSGGVTV